MDIREEFLWPFNLSASKKIMGGKVASTPCWTRSVDLSLVAWRYGGVEPAMLGAASPWLLPNMCLWVPGYQ
jgi:hypothetical protein